jgi:hypothetical protein
LLLQEVKIIPPKKIKINFFIINFVLVNDK